MVLEKAAQIFPEDLSLVLSGIFAGRHSAVGSFRSSENGMGYDPS